MEPGVLTYKGVRIVAHVFAPDGKAYCATHAGGVGTCAVIEPAPSMLDILDRFISDAERNGVELGEITVSPKTWADINSQAAAARKFDATYAIP